MNFGSDVEFLRKHADVEVLASGDEKLIVVPQYQGRVMTSTASGDGGYSFGWINYGLISSGRTSRHINPWGGENRFWLGPEGGQYSLYFAPGTEFVFDHWQVPEFLDTASFAVKSLSDKSISLEKECVLENYSGFKFKIGARRDICLMERNAAERMLSIRMDKNIGYVGYETSDTVLNLGDSGWRKETGLVSIWILGMYKPSNEVVVILPIAGGAGEEYGEKVNIYKSFGNISNDRLKVTDNAVLFKGDGRSLGKIGLSPLRSKDILGSYDKVNNALTVMKFTKPGAEIRDYVNSEWRYQENPYGGDVVNSYNDGPRGSEQLGPFYELENSSPALELRPGGSYTHKCQTFHFTGAHDVLVGMAEKLFGIRPEDLYLN